MTLRLPVVTVWVHTARMGKRKVSTSYTHRIGRQSKTTTYVHDDGPSKTSRFIRFVGISPWDQRRFLIAAWVFALMVVLGQSEALGWVLIALSVAAVAGVKIRRSLSARPAQPVPEPVPVGPAWCDHCADWTVHPTEAHAA
jgi:hypothetical protein